MLSQPSENTKEANHKHPEELSIGTFTDEEYQEALSVMAANRGKGDARKSAYSGITFHSNAFSE